MKKIKRTIMIIFILIILLVIIIAVINKKEKNNAKLITDTETKANVTQEENKMVIDEINNRSDYFLVKTCMQNYCQALNTQNNAYSGYYEGEQLTQDKKNKLIAENIYNLLSDNYINENKINTNNIYQYIKTLKTADTFIPLEIKSIADTSTDKNATENIVSYAVYGLVENTVDYITDQKICVILNIDRNNLIFSVEPMKTSSIDDIKITNYKTSITQNDYNKFSYPTLTKEDISKDYIEMLKNISLAEPEIIYKKLDKDYAKERFGSEQEYAQYIKENKNKIISTRLEKYKVNNYDDYTQYICIDQNENYYVFNEKSILDYTVMLDAYTIDLPEFTEKYSSASDSNKIAMNIEKIREAINDKDYKYVYSKLYDIFKTNNFPTEDSLKKYLLANLFENNKFEYSNVDEQNGTYIFTINVTDATGTDSTTKKLNMIMKLEERTDFVMSFSMQ